MLCGSANPSLTQAESKCFDATAYPQPKFHERTISRECGLICGLRAICESRMCLHSSRDLITSILTLAYWCWVTNHFTTARANFLGYSPSDPRCWSFNDMWFLQLHSLGMNNDRLLTKRYWCSAGTFSFTYAHRAMSWMNLIS